MNPLKIEVEFVAGPKCGYVGLEAADLDYLRFEWLPGGVYLKTDRITPEGRAVFEWAPTVFIPPMPETPK